MAYEKRQKAIDLQHHISDFARARVTTPLKRLQKYIQPGTYMLGGGQYYFGFLADFGELILRFMDRFAQSCLLPFQQHCWGGSSSCVVPVGCTQVTILVYLVVEYLQSCLTPQREDIYGDHS